MAKSIIQGGYIHYSGETVNNIPAQAITTLKTVTVPDDGPWVIKSRVYSASGNASYLQNRIITPSSFVATQISGAISLMSAYTQTEVGPNEKGESYSVAAYVDVSSKVGYEIWLEKVGG